MAGFVPVRRSRQHRDLGLGRIAGDRRGGRARRPPRLYAFLSTFAWSLVLGTVAVTVRRGLASRAAGQRTIASLAALGWALFPLGVLGGPEVPFLGWVVAKVAAVTLVVPPFTG